MEYQSSLKLHCFCFTSHFYWCRKLASLPRPIRCKSKTNHDLVARIFPRFRQFGSFYSEFSLALKILSFFWLAVVITSVLVSPNPPLLHPSGEVRLSLLSITTALVWRLLSFLHVLSLPENSRGISVRIQPGRLPLICLRNISKLSIMALLKSKNKK